jgi:hypothetical protein
VGGYADAPASAFRHRPGFARVLKVLAVVDPGSPVTIRVPLRLRRVMALVYDPTLWSSQQIRPKNADAIVRFDPCGDQRGTQFNGGIAVSGPGCYSLSVTSDGAVGTIDLPLGVPCD